MPFTSPVGGADNPEALPTLIGEIASCRLCMMSRHPLPHAPRPIVVASNTARILIASQAPGLKAHVSGRPFDDASGDRLRQWLGVDRETFYNPDCFAILPMGFCFPGYDAHGSDLPPRRECAPQWRDRVLSHMPQIQLVLTIGGHAQRWHLAKRARGSMTDTVRDWATYLESGHLPLPHPSWRNTGWIRKNPWFEDELLPELRRQVLRWIS